MGYLMKLIRSDSDAPFGKNSRRKHWLGPNKGKCCNRDLKALYISLVNHKKVTSSQSS